MTPGRQLGDAKVTVVGGDFAALARSVQPSLVAENFAAITVRSHMAGLAQPGAFLAEHGMPRVVAHLTREHVREWLAGILAERAPATAAARYKGARAFFDWLVEDGVGGQAEPLLERRDQLRLTRPRRERVAPDAGAEEDDQRAPPGLFG